MRSRVSDDAPTKAELKALHATIKKVEDDIEKLSLNTSVSQFMICVNELTELKCNKRAILEPLTIVLSSFAPHICEELWQQLGHGESISFATYPKFEAAHSGGGQLQLSHQLQRQDQAATGAEHFALGCGGGGHRGRPSGSDSTLGGCYTQESDRGGEANRECGGVVPLCH
jgi:leucyl-tRNA synthetase